MGGEHPGRVHCGDCYLLSLILRGPESTHSLSEERRDHRRTAVRYRARKRHRGAKKQLTVAASRTVQFSAPSVTTPMARLFCREQPRPVADPPSARSATAHSALRARTGKRASGRPSPTGTVSARPPPCSATSTAT